MASLSPDQINGIIAGVTEAARQIFPVQTAEAEAWIQQQVQAKIQEKVAGQVTDIINNPLFLVILGILAYKFLK